MDIERNRHPVSFRLAGTYGYVFAIMFLLYGAVNIVLGFLDHNYTDIGKPVAILIMGLVFLAPVIAYYELKTWGYWGLVGLNGFVVISALVNVTQYYNIVPLVLSAVALFFLLSPSTKDHLFKRR